MAAKVLIDNEAPETQSYDAVKQLIRFYNHNQEPTEMPAFYRLGPAMVLVLSNKKDSYYVVTPKSCSCASAIYNPGCPCKHQRSYFGMKSKTQSHEVPGRINGGKFAMPMPMEA
jgi:hypothetical protein